MYNTCNVQEKAHRARIIPYKQRTLKLGSSLGSLAHRFPNVCCDSWKVKQSLAGSESSKCRSLLTLVQGKVGCGKELYPSSLESWMQFKCVSARLLSLFLMCTTFSVASSFAMLARGWYTQIFRDLTYCFVSIHLPFAQWPLSLWPFPRQCGMQVHQSWSQMALTIHSGLRRGFLCV